MANAGGDARIGIIFELMRSYLMNSSAQNFELAGTHLKSASKMMGVVIPPVPLSRVIYPSDNEEWRTYCLRNEPKVMEEWDKLLRAYSGGKNRLKIDLGGSTRPTAPTKATKLKLGGFSIQ
jgi:hypothetical protein